MDIFRPSVTSDQQDSAWNRLDNDAEDKPPLQPIRGERAWSSESKAQATSPPVGKSHTCRSQLPDPVTSWRDYSIAGSGTIKFR